jgi:hypothetical protein
MANKIQVTGKESVIRAFDNVARDIDDLSDAHRAEADMLLPDVQSATRKDTGSLASAWRPDSIATEAQFVNDLPYAGVQEYGWSERNIEPTLAVQQAFESNEKRTEEVYADHIARAGSKAGFDASS